MRIVVSHLGLRELLLLMGVYMMVMKIVSKNSFKVVGILVESDWRNIHKKMREAWSVFKERVEEIKERKGDYYFDISLAMEEDLFRQLICVEVSNFNDIPVGMTGKVIPAANYIYYQHKVLLRILQNHLGRFTSGLRKMLILRMISRLIMVIVMMILEKYMIYI